MTAMSVACELFIVESAAVIRAVFWDFGGVILSSPFEAFNAYERANGIPVDHIRRVNSTDPDTNAWARIERRELTHDEFDEVFAAESEALGHRIPGGDVIGMLYGSVRPEMVVALDRVIAAGLRHRVPHEQLRHRRAPRRRSRR